MFSRTVHILHLEEEGLSWLGLAGDRRRLEIRAAGSQAGDPVECLNHWALGASLEDAEVFLYDARPMVFSFLVSLPRKARKQADSIIRLKIRQELGLGEDAVRWAAGPLPGSYAWAQNEKQLHLFTLIARREASEDIVQWKERCCIEALWLGSDIGAIRALTSRGLLPSPVLIASGGVGESVLYYDDGGKQVMKTRLAPAEENHDPAQPEPWKEATPCAIFGAVNRESLFARAPALRDLPKVSPIHFDRSGREREFDDENSQTIARLDAVLMGGLVEAGFKRPAMGSLLGPVDFPSPWARYGRKLPPRKTALAALAASFLFVLSLWGLQIQRSHAKDAIGERALALESKTRELESHESVLRKFKADRVSNLPILEAVNKAAPPETTLQSLDIAENGALQILATAKSDRSATTFFRQLAESRLFEKTQLQNLKIDSGKKWVTFQLTAQIKGRKKR